jgi:hypothetical protein
MTVEDYKQAMAELGVDRAALETGLPPDDLGSVTATKEKAYIAPQGWKLSKVPLPPPDIAEDLSHLNPKSRGRVGNRKQ